MNLADISQEEKTATIPFPGFEGFEVTVGLVTRQTGNSIRKQSTEMRINERHGAMEETLNEDKFVAKFVAVAVKGWKGLTGAHIKDLMPVDESKVEDEDEIPFTTENAIMLMKRSATFDNWVNEVVFKLKNFRKG